MNHLRRLEAEGIVHEVSGLPGRAKRWVAPDVFKALDPSARIDFDPGS